MLHRVLLVIGLSCCTFLSGVRSTGSPMIRPEYERFPILAERPCGCPQPKDCQDILELGFWQSGVYTVYVGPYNQSLEVYCELDQEAGIGWLVFQRRVDGFLSFYRNWNSYANGFGNLRGEFWLGNHYLYLITNQKEYGLKIVLEDFNGQTAFAEYTLFEVAAPNYKYTLRVDGYNLDSTAGDSLMSHNDLRFTTNDRDYDQHESGNCAKTSHGAWWHNRCKTSNLNGRYYTGAYKSDKYDGVNWNTWQGNHYSLKKTVMMITPM